MAKQEQVIHVNPEREAKFGLAAMVRSGSTLYVSGLLAVDDEFQVVGVGDMAAQIERIYDRLEATLAVAGADLTHVVSEVSYTTDIEGLASASSVRDARYRRALAAPPVATAVEVRRLFLPDAQLELVATAELP